ncbi:MAG TPA: hypothetical protein VF796_16340 [Humisphaera sp.]
MSHPLPQDVPPARARSRRVAALLLLWTGVCGAAAAPSFYIASDVGYRKGGMVAGIALFVLAYTIVTSRDAFVARWRRERALRVACYVGYGLRTVLGLALPVGMIIDLFPGLVSTEVARWIGMGGTTFFPTLATTVIHGVLLNVIVGTVVGLLFGVLRPALRPEDSAQGFPVLPLTPEPWPRPVQPVVVRSPAPGGATPSDADRP